MRDFIQSMTGGCGGVHVLLPLCRGSLPTDPFTSCPALTGFMMDFVLKPCVSSHSNTREACGSLGKHKRFQFEVTEVFGKHTIQGKRTALFSDDHKNSIPHIRLSEVTKNFISTNQH